MVRASILQALSCKLATAEQNSSFSGLHINCWHRESSLQLKGFFLNGAVWWMLKSKDYRAFDTVFSSLCGFIDWVTWYTQPTKLTRVHAIYRSLMIKFLTGNWILGGTRELLKLYGLETSGLKKRSSNLFLRCAHQKYPRWRSNFRAISSSIPGVWRSYPFWMHASIKILKFMPRRHTEGRRRGEQHICKRNLCWWNGNKEMSS